jgi:hypothetical protein
MGKGRNGQSWTRKDSLPSRVDVDEDVGVATHSLVMPGLTGMSSSWTFLGGADASICVMTRSSLVRGAVRARVRR